MSQRLWHHDYAYAVESGPTVRLVGESRNRLVGMSMPGYCIANPTATSMRILCTESG
ncbi:MAG: hypothetical protein NVSMB60_31220 [Mycobacterium sp.]